MYNISHTANLSSVLFCLIFTLHLFLNTFYHQYSLFHFKKNTHYTNIFSGICLDFASSKWINAYKPSCLYVWTVSTYSVTTNTSIREREKKSWQNLCDIEVYFPITSVVLVPKIGSWPFYVILLLYSLSGTYYTQTLWRYQGLQIHTLIPHVHKICVGQTLRTCVPSEHGR